MSRSRRRFLVESAVASAALLHPGLRSFAAGGKAKAKSPFLEGNFAPLRKEFTEEKLPVTGTLPKGLNGLFVRNGPNPQFDPLGNYHWFDGDGMLHGVRLRDGVASYRNRSIETTGFLEEKKAGKALYKGMQDIPDLKKVAEGKNPFKNPANTALVYHSDKLLALWEGGEPYEIEVPGLGTVGPQPFGGKLKHPFTAHPKVDPATGEMLAFGYIPTKPLALFSTFDKTGKLLRTAPITLPHASMIHDFAITENFALFPACPQTFEMKRMFTGQSPWYFDKDKPTTWVLVPRDGKAKPQNFEAKTCFAFHLLNAWEDGDDVIVVGCRYSRFPGALAIGEADDKNESNASVPYKWTLNRKTGKVAEEAIDKLAAEFPRHHDGFVGRKLQYGYFGIGDGEFFGGLRKWDLTTGKGIDHTYGDGMFGGEGVFVPKPGGKKEDEGWLMTFVYDKANDKSHLTIIDAGDVSAKPVATIQLPTRVPYGFHGTWVAGV